MTIEKQRAFIIKFIFYAIVTAVAVVVLKWGVPMLSPFVMGFLVAYLLRWPTRYLTEKWGLPHKPVALGLVLVFYSTIGFLIVYLFVRVFTGIQNLVPMIPMLYTTHIVPVIEDVFAITENFIYDLDEDLFNLIQGYGSKSLESLTTFVTELSGKAVSWLSGFVVSIPDLFVRLVLMVISTCFIASDYDKLRAFCIRQMGKKSELLFIQIKQYLVGTLFVCIASYVIIASLTFIELSIGLSILKINHAVLVAICIAIFDILPVLGTGGIMIPWGIICLVRGNIPMGLSLLLIYAIITVIRNIVEPKFVGGQLGLHPVVTLSSMFAGLQMFGVLGMFGFPIGLSLLCYLDKNGTIHILK